MEVWLRGPVPGVPPVFMPAAHALLGALEDMEKVASALSPAELWARPGGAAPVGFHLRHVAGSTDRLFTYARGQGLDDAQRAALAAEQDPGDPPPSAEDLIAGLRSAVEAAIDILRQSDPDTATEPRPVGRAGLPSTVLGLFFHAAEHAQRHSGQAIATAKATRGGIR